MERVDVIIVGQGLAGTAVAWRLRWAGLRFMILDREPPSSSSRVAAGLLTPITGQRLVVSWRWHNFWRTAVEFYDRVAEDLGEPVLSVLPVVRLLDSATERQRLTERRADPDFAALAVAEIDPPITDPRCDVSHGGFTMPRGGRLDTVRYLDRSRAVFEQAGCYRRAEVDPATDVTLTEHGVELPRLGLSARRLIFCEGLAATNNPWFRTVAFKPAKGELLTVRLPGWVEPRVVHRGVWLLPLGGDVYRLGATYDWARLDDQPTDAGRDELLARLQTWWRGPVEVLDHQAAVRPIHRNQYPVLGWHPEANQLGYLNGLGSKGALQGPTEAAELLAAIDDPKSIAPEWDLNRRTELRGCRP